MDTLIRVAEVWVPSDDGLLLELGGGLYRQAPAFGAHSRAMCFGRGEGLPGRAWDLGRPVLLPTLDPAVFRRAAAAKRAGLASGLAMPVFRDGALTCVVLLLCGAGSQHRGAIELWHNDPRVTGDLRLADGSFAEQASALEAETRDGFLPRGAGLPGRTWQRGASVFVDDLLQSRHFLRSQTAAAAGIVRALSMPCSVADEHIWVVNLMASAEVPVARRVESWIAADDGSKALRRGAGHCEQRGRLAEASLSPPTTMSPPGISRAWFTGVAQAVDDLAGCTEPPLADALADGLQAVLAIPVIADGGVSEVVALYF
jgi:hypothetical protein